VLSIYEIKTFNLPEQLAELMHLTSFADEVINSALDPNKRKYKKLKIKVTKDDDQLEIE